MNILEKKKYGDFVVQVATETHRSYAEEICNEMENSAKARGTGIAKRKPEYIEKKISEGKAVICLTSQGKWVGFCYIETWDHGNFVANSGLIVSPEFRNSGMATKIKAMAFRLSRFKYPEAKIIGLTTSMAVMKINSELGYLPVPFSELPKDDEFWKGCSTCVNFGILNRTNRSHCLCTGMKYNPNLEKGSKKREFWDFIAQSSIYEGFMRMKQRILLNREDKTKKKAPTLLKTKEQQEV